MGWGGRREGGSGWGTHVNPWLIHVNAWQIPLQYCKVISLQLIKINKKSVSCRCTIGYLVVHTYMYFFRFFLFPYTLLWNTEYNSLYYATGPCWLSVSYIVVCYPSLFSFRFGNHSCFLCLWVYFCFVYKFTCIIKAFLDSTCKWYHIVFVILCLYDHI